MPYACALLVALTLGAARAGDTPPAAPDAPPRAPGADGANAEKPSDKGEAGKDKPADPAGEVGKDKGDAPAEGGGKAGARGVVVRLDAGTEKVDTPVVVHLKPDEGDLTDVQLKDDGAPPDVTGGDGTWSGTMWNEHDVFSVTVNLGSTKIDGGKISWAADDSQRDLSLTLTDGQLTAEAGVASSGGGSPGTPPDGAPAGGAPTEGGGAAPAPGGFQLDGKGTGGSGSPYTSSGGDATLYVVLGVGVLGLAIIAHLYLRGGRSRPSGGLPNGVTVVPETGVLGTGTPALSEGLSQWVVNPTDAHDLLRPLLATLSRHRRVLVVAPARSALPSVAGGPVYRMAPGKPNDLADAVEALVDLGGGGVTVLMLGDGLDGPALKGQADALPEGVGGAVLVLQVLMATLPVVNCERKGAGWHLRFTNGDVEVVEGPDGFQRVG